MTLWTVLAAAWSAALIAVLCSGDPKRRRTARALAPRALAPPQGTVVRPTLAAATCLPGLIFVIAGDAPGFLIWLGAAAVAGWIVTLWFNRPAESR